MVARLAMIPVQIWSDPMWLQFVGDTLPEMIFASAWSIMVTFFVQLVGVAEGVGANTKPGIVIQVTVSKHFPSLFSLVRNTFLSYRKHFSHETCIGICCLWVTHMFATVWSSGFGSPLCIVMLYLRGSVWNRPLFLSASTRALDTSAPSTRGLIDAPVSVFASLPFSVRSQGFWVCSSSHGSSWKGLLVVELRMSGINSQCTLFNLDASTGSQDTIWRRSTESAKCQTTKSTLVGCHDRSKTISFEWDYFRISQSTQRRKCVSSERIDKLRIDDSFSRHWTGSLD